MILLGIFIRLLEFWEKGGTSVRDTVELFKCES